MKEENNSPNNPLQPEDFLANSRQEASISGKRKGGVETIKFIFQRVFELFTSPTSAFKNIRTNESIGWPFLVLMGVFIIYILLVLIFGTITAGGSSFSWWEYITSGVFRNNILKIIAVIIYFSLIIIFQSMAVWGSTFFWGNTFAHLYGGRGKWYQYAVANLYLQIFSFILAFPLLIIVTLIGFIFESATVTFYSFIVFALILLIWGIFLQIMAMRVYYELSILRSILAVFTPLILAGIIIYLFYRMLFGGIGNIYNDYVSTAGRSSLGEIEFEETGSGSNLNMNLNTNLSLVPYWQLSSNFRSENSTGLAEELLEIPIDTNPYDKMRQQDLITLKYLLDAYYEYHKKYPKTNGRVKLDGSDVLNSSLGSFMGYEIAAKDPQYPKYYYSYESDGLSYTLTCYLVDEKKVYTITSSD